MRELPPMLPFDVLTPGMVFTIEPGKGAAAAPAGTGE